MNFITENPCNELEMKSKISSKSSSSLPEKDELLQKAKDLDQRRVELNASLIGMEIDCSPNDLFNIDSDFAAVDITDMSSRSPKSPKSPELIGSSEEDESKEESFHEIKQDSSSDDDEDMSEIIGLRFLTPDHGTNASENTMKSNASNNNQSQTNLENIYEELHCPSSEEGLRDALEKLPISISLFCIPLDRDYSQDDLNTFGVHALKGTDKSMYKTISSATDCTWNKILIQVEQSFEEVGGIDDNDSFVSAYPDESNLVNVYSENGCKLDRNQYNWMRKYSFNECIEDLGIVLVQDSYDLDEWWRSGKPVEISIRYEDHNPLDSAVPLQLKFRTTKFTKTFLFVFSDSAALHSMLSTKAYSSLRPYVSLKPAVLLPKLLNVLDQPVLNTYHFRLSSDACNVIINLFNDHARKLNIKMPKAVERILTYYVRDEYFYNCKREDCLAESLIRVINNNGGWNSPQNSFLKEVLLDSIDRIPKENACKLLKKIDYILRLTEIQGSNLQREMKKVISDFLRDKYSCDPHNIGSFKDFHDIILHVQRYHDWTALKPAIYAGFTKLCQGFGRFSEFCLRSRAIILRDISFHVLDFDDYRLCNELAEDIVTVIERNSTRNGRKKRTRSNDYVSNVLSSNIVDLLLGFVIDFGDSKHFQRLESWGTKACLVDLSNLVRSLEKVSPDSLFVKRLARYLRRTKRISGLEEPLNEYQTARKRLRRNVTKRINRN